MGRPVKLLLVMTLIAVQLLSAGVAPMYVCLGCNGLVWQEHGADSCDCCTPVAVADVAECSCCPTAGCDDVAVNYDEPATLVARDPLAIEGTSSDMACSCTRLPISARRVPVLTANRAKTDGLKPLACATALSCKARTCRDLAWSPPRFHHGPDGPSLSFALRVLSTVNLRC